MILLVVGMFLVGVAAILAELFLPTFGILGVVGAGSLVASVVVSFRSLGGTAGSVTLLAALVVTPVLLMLFFRFFPKTFFGRRLILSARQDARNGFTAHAESSYAGLTGRSGRTLTTMRPSGAVEIDGRRHDATASGEYLEAGIPVRVLRVEGNRIVVHADFSSASIEQRRRET